MSDAQDLRPALGDARDAVIRCSRCFVVVPAGTNEGCYFMADCHKGCGGTFALCGWRPERHPLAAVREEFAPRSAPVAAGEA